MDEIRQCQRIIDLLEQLLEFAELHERCEIQKMIKRRKLRKGLLELQSGLEEALSEKFDPNVSRKLDALEVILGQ